MSLVAAFFPAHLEGGCLGVLPSCSADDAIRLIFREGKEKAADRMLACGKLAAAGTQFAQPVCAPKEDTKPVHAPKMDAICVQDDGRKAPPCSQVNERTGWTDRRIAK